MRVLVVDDDGLTRRLMGRMLARLGCVVDTAEHGQQALDMMLMDPSIEEPYACTFLDNQMVSLCQQLWNLLVLIHLVLSARDEWAGDDYPAPRTRT